MGISFKRHDMGDYDTLCWFSLYVSEHCGVDHTLFHTAIAHAVLDLEPIGAPGVSVTFDHSTDKIDLSFDDRYDGKKLALLMRLSSLRKRRVQAERAVFKHGLLNH